MFVAAFSFMLYREKMNRKRKNEHTYTKAQSTKQKRIRVPISVKKRCLELRRSGKSLEETISFMRLELNDPNFDISTSSWSDWKKAEQKLLKINLQVVLGCWNKPSAYFRSQFARKCGWTTSISTKKATSEDYKGIFLLKVFLKEIKWKYPWKFSEIFE